MRPDLAVAGGPGVGWGLRGSWRRDSVPVGLSWPRVAASRSFGRNYLAGAVITKDFRTYSTKILRREKILRDHGDALR